MKLVAGVTGTHGPTPVRPAGVLPGRVLPGRFDAAGTLRETVVVASMAWLLVTASLAGWSLLPMLAGWRPVVITSGSMTPLIRPGDVVLVDPSVKTVRPGLVVYVKPLTPGSAAITHRVVRVEDDGDLITKGDANRVEDSTPVVPERNGGVARLAVPNAGRIAMAWLRHEPSDLAWAGVTLLAVLVAGGSLLFRREDEDVEEPLERVEWEEHEAEEREFWGQLRQSVADPGLDEALPVAVATHAGSPSHATSTPHGISGLAGRVGVRTWSQDSLDLGLGYPTDSVFVPRPRVPALPARLLSAPESAGALLPPEPPEFPEARESVDLRVPRLMPLDADPEAVVVGISKIWMASYVPLRQGVGDGRHLISPRRSRR